MKKLFLFILLLVYTPCVFAYMIWEIKIDGLSYKYIETDTEHYVTVSAYDKTIKKAHVLSHVTRNNVTYPVTQAF